MRIFFKIYFIFLIFACGTVLSSSAYEPLVYTDISNKTQVTLQKNEIKESAVILTFGQSNAANSGEGLYKVKNQVFNIFQGKYFIADDPLLDATGVKGSVWGRVSDRLIDNGLYDKIIIKSIAIGGSPLVSWTPLGVGIVHGNYFQRIVDAVYELRKLNIKITHMLWHQGEQDMSFGTTTKQYKHMFLDMLSGIRKLGVDAPVYVARASSCQGRHSLKVIKAQNELIKEYSDILQGPNTDLINDSRYRVDGGCHFSELGLALHANKWYESIVLNEN